MVSELLFNIQEKSSFSLIYFRTDFSIGVRFAMILARVALISLLKNFEFSLDSKTTVPVPMNEKLILFTPKDGVYLKVKPLK